MGRQLEPLARAFAERLQDLSCQADLSDPRRHPFQHGLRADPGARMGGAVRRRAGGRHPRLGGRPIRQGPRLPGVGAGRGRIPFAGADRGAVHGAGAAKPKNSPAGSRISCRACESASLRPCSRPLSSVTAATARSLISTGSISAAPGAGGRLPLLPEGSSRSRRQQPTSISLRRCRMWRAIIWASIGWRASRCWRC